MFALSQSHKEFLLQIPDAYQLKLNAEDENYDAKERDEMKHLFNITGTIIGEDDVEDNAEAQAAAADGDGGDESDSSSDDSSAER